MTHTQLVCFAVAAVLAIVSLIFQAGDPPNLPRAVLWATAAILLVALALAFPFLHAVPVR